MKVTVLGGGSWGTTVASLVSHHHDTLLWARDANVVDEINDHHRSSGYLPGFALCDQLRATSVLADAAQHAELLIVGVPSQGFRAVLEVARPHVRPWIPAISLSKGLETGTLLRMTQVLKEVLPGRPAAALTGLIRLTDLSHLWKASITG